MAERVSFRIHGMDCADEVAILRKAVEPIVKVPERLSFDILRGKMTVAPGEPAVTVAQIADAVNRTGLRAEVWQDEQPKSAGTFWERRQRTLLTATCGMLTIAAFAVHARQDGIVGALGSEGTGLAVERLPIGAVLLYVGAIVCGGWFIVPRAVHAIRQLRPDMNLLMTIAVFGAAAIGEWFEAAVVTFLFAVSLALESWSVNRARRAVEALMAIAPPTARVIRAEGAIDEVNASDVAVGTLILVKPGDRVPLDGNVRRGSSQVNQAPITGESMPVEKAPGAEVFAGTVNGDGALEVEVTRVAGETTLAQIIRMVEEAQSRRAPSEQWVDQFARVYTPAILAIAVVIAIGGPVVTGQDPWTWVYRSLVLLVIGCPCALVISTPVSIVASLAAAAKAGVLVKGGAYIEAPARLRALALDKTGTLTMGSPRVVDVLPLAGHSEHELLTVMGAIEAHSDHPLARAIVADVRERGFAFPQAEDVQAIQGRGITATVEGRRYWLGSHRYLEESGQQTPELELQITTMTSSGRTVVIMGTADHVCGLISLADAVRPESKATIDALHAAGVEKVVMLTGDNKSTAERIAKEVGISDVRAELLPVDKVSAIEELVARYKYVAMIGDGVNDAPAMGRATIGIAMGAAGSDAAIEAADVALMSDDLGKLPWLIEHSRRTLAVIRQNVTLSLAIKVLFVVLTFAGFASLWAAIAADMGVSIVVIANALRLLRAE